MFWIYVTLCFMVSRFGERATYEVAKLLWRYVLRHVWNVFKPKQGGRLWMLAGKHNWSWTLWKRIHSIGEETT